MLTAQIGAESNNINNALDELKSARRKVKRRSLLTEALSASDRALSELVREPLITKTKSYVDETLRRHEMNALAVAEELRMDQATLRWFIKAECDLLRAEGFNDSSLEAIERDLLAVLERPILDTPESLEQRFRGLIRRVKQDLRQLEREGELSDMYRHIAQVLGVLGGCAVVAADTAAAAATVGVASPLLAISIPLGSEVISLSLTEGF